MLELYKILTFPEDYQRMPALDDDPQGCVNYATTTAAAQGVVQAYPISKDEAMNFGHPQEVIDHLHETLGASQAVIEVEDGTNSNGMPYIYSIVKSRANGEADTSASDAADHRDYGRPSEWGGGTQYTLIFHGLCGHEVFCVRALFTERGVTGKREAAVWNYLRDRGVVSDHDTSKWARDPYDRSMVRSYLMNLSERADFDEAFPDHPLSVCRALVRFWKGESEDFFF